MNKFLSDFVKKDYPLFFGRFNAKKHYKEQYKYLGFWNKRKFKSINAFHYVYLVFEVIAIFLLRFLAKFTFFIVGLVIIFIYKIIEYFINKGTNN